MGGGGDEPMDRWMEITHIYIQLYSIELMVKNHSDNDG